MLVDFGCKSGTGLAPNLDQKSMLISIQNSASDYACYPNQCCTPDLVLRAKERVQENQEGGSALQGHEALAIGESAMAAELGGAEWGSTI